MPAAPTVASAGVSSVAVSWTVPANAGPPVTDYDYQYRVKTPTGTWTEVTNTAITALSATIASLMENTEYEVQVRATNAEGTSGWSDSGNGSTDANAAPVFSTSAAFAAAENQTAVGTVQASDGDGADSVTGYAIEGGADASEFTIDAATGVLTFVLAPNYEDASDADGNNAYVVVVRATSGADARVKTADQTITVTVTDVEGEAPGAPAAPTVASAGVSSVAVSWTVPANAGPPVTDYDYQYRVKTPTGTWTEVTNTAITALSATITSLMENTEYEVQVRATNAEGTSGWSDSGNGSTDANAAPVFSTSAAFAAAENQTAVGTVQASDGDGADSVTGYAIDGGADASEFTIDAETGVLTFAQAPNYEDASDADGNNAYVVVVRATSGTDDRVKTADQTITVTVTDVEGEAPGVPAAPTVVSAGVTSVTVSWVPPANAGPPITDYDYQYRVKTPTGTWTEVTNTAITALSATITSLMENTEYDVQVRATNDEGTSGWSDSGNGSTDANAAPSFTSAAAFAAAENQTAVGTVQASDGDGADSVTGYAIEGGADASEFTIDAATGVLTFVLAPNFEVPTDADGNNAYVVVVRATSGADARVKTADQTITVTVTDVEGEAPGVPAAPTVAAAGVSSVAVSWTVPVNAGPPVTDYDYQYRVKTPTGTWTEVTNTAITALSATITSLMEHTEYDVQVRATNAEGTSGWSDSGNGSTDANAAPSFTSAAAFAAAENQTAVGTVQASDGDGADSVTGYAIEGGADASEFTIDAATGVLTFVLAPNFEVPTDADGNNAYVVVVRATSGADARVKTADQTITVTVTDVGGEAPGVPAAPTVASAGVSSVAVSWTVPVNAGPPVTDYDYQYRVKTPTGTWTEVTNTAITALSATITSLMENTEYEVQVRATNAEGTSGWSDSGNGSTDANAAPVFSTPAAFAAAENQTAVGTVQASDGDGADSVTGYAIEGGADASEFTIDAATGVLTFAQAPNYEDASDADGNNAYVVVVRATSGADARVKTADQTITVTVTDVEGEAPGAPAAPTVASAGVSSVAVSWTVPANAGPPVTDYDYRHRVKTPTGTWTEVTNTAITALSATITSLMENTEYEVQVRATNAEGTSGWSDSGNGSTDANVAPVFSTSAAFAAAENQTAVGTVQASDGDGADSVTGYAIEGGADASEFTIDAATGVLTFAQAPNYEDASDADGNNAYVVVVRATSGADARVKTADQTITVTVTDVEGEAPGAPAAPTVVSAGVSSVAVSWTVPANAGPPVTDYDYQYRVKTPTGTWTEVTNTAITALSATITSLMENTEYEVQVRATNAEGTSGWSDSGNGSSDANAAPVFSTPAAFAAAENQTAVGTVQASDGDGADSVTGYAIEGGADASEFTIDAATGVLTFVLAPNCEDPTDADRNNAYVLIVRATSGADARVKTADQTITVTVTDVEGEAPGVPAAPRVVSAGVTSVTVTWVPPANTGPPITDYDYQYRVKTPTGTWTEVTNTAITALSATITSLMENTEYEVQVRATNAEGTSDWSEPGSGSTDANVAPVFSTPAAFAAAENQTAVGTVRASDGDGADSVTGFAIAGGADASKFAIGNATGVLTFVQAPNFEVPSDSDGNNAYVVVVRATSGADARVKTADQTITVTVTDVGGEAPGVPAAPSVVSAGVTSVTVSWVPPTNAGPPIMDYDYRYRVKTPTGTWTEVTSTAITALNATIMQLMEDTEYEVQVRATNDDGTSSWSEVGSGSTDAASVIDNTAPRVASITISPSLEAGEEFQQPRYTMESFLALPDEAVHGLGATLTFTLNFNMDVTVILDPQTQARPELKLDLFGRERRALYTGPVGTSTSTMVFSWTVEKGDNDPDGIEVRELVLNGATIQNSQERDAALLTFPTAPHKLHRVRGGLHAMWLVVSGSAREGEPLTVKVERSGGFEELAHAIVRVTDSGVAALTPEEMAGSHGSSLMSFPFDADPEQGEDSRFSVQTVTPPGDGEADGARTLELKLIYTALGDGEGRASYWYETRDPVEVLVPVADTGLAKDAPSLSVRDAWTQEPTPEQWARGTRFPLLFEVVLEPAGTGTVTVDFATHNGTAVAGADFMNTSGTLTFRAGETRKMVEVAVMSDYHDEVREMMTFTLDRASGAHIADGEATGTIRNSGPIPQAWIARFGRTVAEQAMEAVEARFEAPRVPGLAGSLAGQVVTGFGERADGEAQDPREGLDGLAAWLGGKDGHAGASESRPLTGREVLAGSTFALTGGTAESGLASLWGRSAVTRFDGRDGALSLDGEVASGMLGADWTRDRVLAGLMLSHSRGKGGYRGNSNMGMGSVESTLTALFPYGRYALSERVSVWGIAGAGEGTLTLTPGDGTPMRPDMAFLMGAVGVRGILLDGAGGWPTLAAKSDAFAVRTRTDGVSASANRLGASQGDVTRVRFALEGSQTLRLWGDVVLTPGLELGVRHDGGDAETGFGADIGAGLALSAPSQGVSADLRARGLLTHEAGSMREQGVSGTFAFDPAPDSDRGISLSLSQTVGAQASGGADALFARPTLTGIGAEQDEGPLARRLEARLGYGLGVFDDRWTATPEIGLGLSDTGREVRLGWRLTEQVAAGLAFDLGVEGTRRENSDGAASPAHGLKLGLGWRLAGASASHTAFKMRIEMAHLEAANDDARSEEHIGLKLIARW